MLIAQKNVWFAAVVIAAALTPLAFADGKNEIRAVAFSEDPGGTTLVRVRGAQTPTFTVYKLERPSRVVIDVPQARLAEALRGHEGATVFMPGSQSSPTGCGFSGFLKSAMVKMSSLNPGGSEDI